MPQKASLPAAARRAPFPSAPAPMQASPTDAPFSHAGWLFEPKLDGIRALALVRDGDVKLLSRRGLNVTSQFPAVAAELAEHQSGELVLDGEIVALDERGVPSFQRLQGRLNLTDPHDVRRAGAAIPVVYYVFDLLHADGHDVRAAPLEERNALLARRLVPSPNVRLVEHFDEEGRVAFEAAVANGLEGVIAKERGSAYESGRRSSRWLKVKGTTSDEFVLVGYTRGTGHRERTFGALILASRAPDGSLAYVGHVGTGFDDRSLAALKKQLDALREGAERLRGAPSLKQPTWVRPELVAEVRFVERTRDGRLRAPVFLRLRPDKAPAEVTPISAIAPPPAADPAVADVLAQLAGRDGKLTLSVHDQLLPLTNLDRVYWPATADAPPVTKRDLLVYLARLSPHLLAHLRDRPLSLVRYPTGLGGPRFYQKGWQTRLPPFVETVSIHTESSGEDQAYALCNNLPTLLWLGQMGALELNAWYSRVATAPDAGRLPRTFAGSAAALGRSVLNYPDFLVFDLDPYLYSGREAPRVEPELHREAWEATVEAAGWLKQLLDGLALPSFVKTSGRTGLHVLAPVLRRHDYETTRAAAEAIAQHLVRAHPDKLTAEWAVAKRAGKVFLDFNQNVRGKTVAWAYSPRPVPEATVSVPLRWDELVDVYPTDFTLGTVPSRVADVGDPWTGMLSAKADLGRLLDGGPSELTA